jgi:hypothetical protein
MRSSLNVCALCSICDSSDDTDRAVCTTYNDLCNQAARKIFYDQIGKDLNVNPNVWRSIIEQTYQ